MKTLPIVSFGGYSQSASFSVNPASLLYSAGTRKVALYAELIDSFADAVKSYLSYKRAVEETKQLEHQLEFLENMVSIKRRELEEALRLEEFKIQSHINHLEEKIKLNDEKMNSLKELYQNYDRYLNFVSELLKKHKRLYPYDEKLRDLEAKFIDAVHAKISISMLITGG